MASLKKAMEMAESVDAAKACLIDAKLALIQFIEPFSDIASLADPITKISKSADELIKLMKNPDDNDDQFSKVTKFRELVFSAAADVKTFFGSCNALNAFSKDVYTDYLDARNNFVSVSTKFSDVVAKLKLVRDFGTTTVDEANFISKYITVQVPAWNFEEYLS